METRAWMGVRVPGGKCPTLAGSKEGRKGRLSLELLLCKLVMQWSSSLFRNTYDYGQE